MSGDFPDITLWLIYAEESGDSSGGESILWILTDSPAHLPDVHAAIEEASRGRYSIYHVHSVRSVCPSMGPNPSDFDQIRTDYETVNQTGHAMSPEVAGFIRESILDTIRVDIARRRNSMEVTA